MEAARLERRVAWPSTWPVIRLSPQLLIYVALLLLIANMVLAPLAMVVTSALNVGPTARTPNATLDYFIQAWTSPTTWAVLGNTAIFALGSTSLALTIGV